MRRREFITLIGGAAAARPLLRPRAARAQQPVPVIGYLAITSADLSGEDIPQVRRGLAQAGYAADRDVAVEARFADYRLERLPALAQELVRRRVDVIIAATQPAVLAARDATRSIPIVFVTAADPTDSGFVSGFNRPTGNLTGIYTQFSQLAGKRLELLHELLPAATLIAMLGSAVRNGINESENQEAQAVARALGLRLLALNADEPSEFETAFATAAREKVGGLLLSAYQLFGRHSDELRDLAARYRMPAMNLLSSTTKAGGLISYGPNAGDMYRQLGVYAGRILKGEKIADLPVQQLTRYELAVNLKTAKSLGIEVPTSILLRADEVIE